MDGNIVLGKVTYSDGSAENITQANMSRIYIYAAIGIDHHRVIAVELTDEGRKRDILLSLVGRKKNGRQRIGE